MRSLVSMLKEMHNDEDEPPRPKLAPDIEAIRLRDSLAAYNIKHEFTPGLIVRQKHQARLYRDFGDNDICIVVTMLDPPVIDEGDASTPFFNITLDMVIGSIRRQSYGDCFATYHVDSRRFEPVPEAELALVTGSPPPRSEPMAASIEAAGASEGEAAV